MGRYLELIADKSGDDPAVWVPVSDLTAHMSEHMSRGDDELRTELRLKGLWESGLVSLSADGLSVAITPKGVLNLRGT